MSAAVEIDHVTKTFGAHTAVDDLKTPANKEQNRRVEFKIWEIDGKPTDAQKSEASSGGPATGGTSANLVGITKKDDKKDAKPTATTPAPKK